MDDLKLLGRNENDLKNKIKIVETISKDINMNFVLEKCARICLKRDRVQSKMHIENTFENDIKELHPRKAYRGKSPNMGRFFFKLLLNLAKCRKTFQNITVT